MPRLAKRAIHNGRWVWEQTRELGIRLQRNRVQPLPPLCAPLTITQAIRFRVGGVGVVSRIRNWNLYRKQPQAENDRAFRRDADTGRLEEHHVGFSWICFAACEAPSI